MNAESALATQTLALRVSDVSGQRCVRAIDVPAFATVSEVIDGVLPKLGLGRSDASGRPLSWRARLDREAKHLRGSDVVGEVLRQEDAIVLQPSIFAGSVSRPGHGA